MNSYILDDTSFHGSDRNFMAMFWKGKRNYFWWWHFSFYNYVQFYKYVIYNYVLYWGTYSCINYDRIVIANYCVPTRKDVVIGYAVLNFLLTKNDLVWMVNFSILLTLVFAALYSLRFIRVTLYFSLSLKQGIHKADALFSPICHISYQCQHWQFSVNERSAILNSNLY